MEPYHVLKIGDTPLIDICPANLAVNIVWCQSFRHLRCVTYFRTTLKTRNAGANMTFVFLSYIDANNFEL
jgi:hypothetical protein